MSGPGQIETKPSTPAGADGTSSVDFNLSNFEIDKADVKPELRQHLEDVVIPTLKKNGTAAVTLVGSADRQGDPTRNHQLSVDRANAIKKILNDHGISAQITDTQGVGAPAAGPMDNPADRGVRIALKAPIKIEAIKLYTDDWMRPLKWDDVIGLKGEDGKAIERFNIEVRVSGAPRLLMPESILLRQPVGPKAGTRTFMSRWTLPWAPKSFQPSDGNVTSYRDSGSLGKFGFADRNVNKDGLVVIDRENVPIDFGNGAERPVRAVGVERFVLTGPDKLVVKWFVHRSSAMTTKPPASAA